MTQVVDKNDEVKMQDSEEEGETGQHQITAREEELDEKYYAYCCCVPIVLLTPFKISQSTTQSFHDPPIPRSLPDSIRSTVGQ